MDNTNAASILMLKQFAIIPGILAYLSRLDITSRVIFSDEEVVDGGGYGDIRIAKCNIGRRRNVKVAAKVLRIFSVEDKKRLLEKEVYVWAKLKHANILPLLGYAFDTSTRFPILISEWMENGSAWRYVRNNLNCDLLHLLRGTARGLEYLHKNDFIHSDIKSDNILVTHSGDALICDFGYTRMIDASRSLGNMTTGNGDKGTPHYMAYELVADPETYSKHSKESDVWAFGMTVYELYTRKRPYSLLGPFLVIPQILRQGLPEFPPTPVNPHNPSQAELLQIICKKCWVFELSEQSQISEILDLLEDKLPYQQDQEQQQEAEVNGQLLRSATDSPVTGNLGPEYEEPLYDYHGRENVREREVFDIRDVRDSQDVNEEDLSEQNPRKRNISDGDAREVKRIRTEQPGDYPPPSSGHKPYPESGPSTPLVSSSSTLPQPPCLTPYPPPPSSAGGGGGFLDDIDPETLPAKFKKEGSDWFAVFNPKVKRVLDVNLMNTLSHESVVSCVRFSADGKYLATGCNRTAQIYEVKTGQKVCYLNDESASPVGDLYIRSVCFSPDGKLLATGAEDKTIRIWEIAKKRVIRVFEGHQQEIYSLDFSKNGRLLVSGSGDRTTRIWDMETGMHKVFEINEPDGVDAGVTDVAFSPDGLLVAAGSLDTLVWIWEVQTGNLVERLKGHRDSVYSVAFTPDGKGIVSGSLDKTLKHWDISAIVSGGSRKDPLPTPSSSSSEGVGNGAVVRKDTASTTNNAANNPNGGAGDRGSLNTLNFTGHKDYVLSVAVSHDGQWVVSSSKGRSVQFWEASSASSTEGGAGGGVQAQCMLQGHKNSVISIDLSPTGGVLATGSGDMQARLWSYTTI